MELLAKAQRLVPGMSWLKIGKKRGHIRGAEYVPEMKAIGTLLGTGPRCDPLASVMGTKSGPSHVAELLQEYLQGDATVSLPP